MRSPYLRWTVFAAPVLALMFWKFPDRFAGAQDASSTNVRVINELKQRPLKLPALSAGSPCPITRGSKTSVTHADNVFCATCYWFGNGPVFLALAWSDQTTDAARFSIKNVPYEEHAFRAKTPWVSKPDYAGPILVRGQRIDANRDDYLRFDGAEQRGTTGLIFQAPVDNRTDSSQWSFWPTSMYVPRAGCYGIQIDTPGGSDIVVFETTAR